MHDNALTSIETAASEDNVRISPISAWEISTLVVRGRINLSMPVETWFDKLVSAEGLFLADMPPTVLIRSASLPGNPPNDPADRIIIATAREFDYTIITRDGQILDYARAGLVKAMAC